MLRVFSHYVPARLMLLVLTEALMLALAMQWALSYYPVTLVSSSTPAWDAGFRMAGVAYVGVMLFVLNGMGLYEPEIARRRHLVLVRLSIAALVGLALTSILVLVMFPPFVPFEGLCVGAAAGVAGSYVMRRGLVQWRQVSSFKPRVLVLGAGAGAARLARLAERQRNHRLVGYVDVGQDTACATPVPLPRLLPAHGESLVDIVERYQIEQIVIAVKDRRGGGLPVKDLLDCRLKGVRVTELSTFFEREHRQVLLDSLTPSWMVFGEGFRQGLVRTIIKRLFDVAASFALLVLTLPVMAVTALAIVIESGRPVLYRQERTGRGGRPFTIYKFRSMGTNAESDGMPRWAGANDDRTTRIGRFIRKTRIDELPQIFNVLKGEMSFVGPRPERPFFVDRLTEQIPYYALRHNVKPGITGWAQVSYPYGASVEDAIEKLQYDLYYIKNHTLFLDLVILIATIEVVLWGSGSGAAAPKAAAAAARIGVAVTDTPALRAVPRRHLEEEKVL